MPKKSSGIPATYEQQQQIRQQRQRMMGNKNKDHMAYVEGSGSAAAGAKKRSESVDYSKARTGGYSGPPLATLDKLLEGAQASGDAARIKRIKDQIAAAKKAGAK